MKKNILWLFILVILLSSSCSYYSNLTAYYNTLYNAKESFRKGEELYLQNKNKKTKSRTDRTYFESTIKKCWKLIEFHGYTNKYSDDAILLIAKSEYYLDKYVSAKNHLDGFFEKFPNSDLIPEAIYWRARCDLALGDTSAAISQLNESLVKASKNQIKAKIYLELAEIAFAKNDYEKAGNYYKKALKAAKSKLEKSYIYFYLAESYFNVGNYKEAIKNYKKVIKNPPNDQIEYLAQLHLALSTYNIGKVDQSIKLLENMLTARRFKSFIGDIYSELADIFWKENRKEEAVFYYKKGIKSKVGEGAAKSAFELANHFEKDIGNVDSAVFYYQQVPKLSRSSIWTEKSMKKIKYLQKFLQLKRKVDEEKLYIYRWENDPAFRDSILEVRRLDSLYGSKVQKLQLIPFIQLLKHLSKRDTANLYYTPELLEFAQNDFVMDSEYYAFRLDSIKKVYEKDSLIYLDTIKFPAKDKLARFFFDYQKQKKLFADLKKKKLLQKRNIFQIKEDYKKHYINYADFFLLETPFIDSARTRYEYFVQHFQDSLLVPKAMYSLYYIYKYIQPDSDKAKFYLEHLLTRFPESTYSLRIKKNSQVNFKQDSHNDNTTIDSLKELYHKAEDYFFTTKFDSAILVLRKILQMDTSSEWYPKSLYFLGYIYEKGTHNVDSAKFYYSFLAKKFAHTPYGKEAQKRITLPEESELALKEKTSEKGKNIQLKSQKESSKFIYDEKTKQRIIRRIENYLNMDYMEEIRKGNTSRFWSKKQLRDFLNELQF